MKVYAVSRGSYSDYRIETIFATRTAAEEFTRHHPESGERVEEYTVYDSTPQKWTCYVVQRYGARPPQELTLHLWPWQEASYQGGTGREPVRVSRWKIGAGVTGLRSFGTDKAAVHAKFDEADAEDDLA